ncbi:MAG: RNB domain-containing ribonuclease [Candidatus Thiodiazotropha sp.]
MYQLKPDALVLYKIRPARVVEISDKIAIELEGGKSKRVRDKDIQLLHPGPVRDLDLPDAQAEALEENWELLEGEQTNLQELSELLFGDYNPATAWAAWQIVAEGIYFEGEPERILPRDQSAVREEIETRTRKAREAEAWEGFLQRVREGAILEEDRKPLGEVEALALERREGSRILQALGLTENPVTAHRLLINTGYWPAQENPYPRRLGVDESIPRHPVPALPDEARKDLTHMQAFAIDDQGSEDPDDAVSLDGERIWVHVADVAALVTPDSPMDLEARARGANLYLPDRVVPMLPPEVTDQLGLGLQDRSPALSIGFTLTPEGEVSGVEIQPSWVRVTRISYDEADQRLVEAPFNTLLEKSRIYRERRLKAGAASIQLPEVKIRVVDGEVTVVPLPRLESREMVTDLMLMAGEGVAGYGIEHGIPLPFATQAPPEQPLVPQDMAGMYAYRRQFKPSQTKLDAEPHSGLGLACYSRATSPLRRYADLLTHQQLRAYLRGEAPLDSQLLSERIGQSEIGSAANRKTERISNNHWCLIYLQQHSDWRGEGVVVAREGERATVLIPAIGLESRVRIRGEFSLNDTLKLKPREIDVPDLSCYFRVL